MAEKRIKLVAATWTDLAAELVNTAMGNHLIVRAQGTDFDIAVKASTAPGVAGTPMPVGAAVEVIIGANAAAKVWVRSTAGGYLEIDDIGGKTVITVPSVAVA
jgi:hypothetical protein